MSTADPHCRCFRQIAILLSVLGAPNSTLFGHRDMVVWATADRGGKVSFKTAEIVARGLPVDNELIGERTFGFLSARRHGGALGICS
ncbi:hypothetical protein Rcae01_04144 [Novipirellula caenicola]|uniref:Uncharacterized protein n=1 Tax=Novipirellula caenicola TaxID=1536901 RepID=A0ABP9VU63_9BACT